MQETRNGYPALPPEVYARKLFFLYRFLKYCRSPLFSSRCHQHLAVPPGSCRPSHTGGIAGASFSPTGYRLPNATVTTKTISHMTSPLFPAHQTVWHLATLHYLFSVGVLCERCRVLDGPTWFDVPNTFLRGSRLLLVCDFSFSDLVSMGLHLQLICIYKGIPVSQKGVAVQCSGIAVLAFFKQSLFFVLTLVRPSGVCSLLGFLFLRCRSSPPPAGFGNDPVSPFAAHPCFFLGA